MNFNSIHFLRENKKTNKKRYVSQVQTFFSIWFPNRNYATLTTETNNVWFFLFFILLKFKLSIYLTVEYLQINIHILQEITSWVYISYWIISRYTTIISRINNRVVFNTVLLQIPTHILFFCVLWSVHFKCWSNKDLHRPQY